jgi:16S rRNA (uracil1498-N3)-methyltransferase
MFYCAELACAGEYLTLAGAEAEHARGARRLGVGDGVWLFDGRGTVGHALIVAADRRVGSLRLQVQQRDIIPPEFPRVELACALPKGERQTVLLDMATQLGMTEFYPLLCERSIVKPGRNAAQRWRRICLEACKQSRRAYLPVVHAPLTLAQLLASHDKSDALWVADPSGLPLSQVSSKERERLLLIVGPEGGFNATELMHIVDAGAQTINLGKAVLRTETAAITLLANISPRDVQWAGGEA